MNISLGLKQAGFAFASIIAVLALTLLSIAHAQTTTTATSSTSTAASSSVANPFPTMATATIPVSAPVMTPVYTTVPNPASTASHAPMIFTVDEFGNTLLRGTVVASGAGSTTLEVSGWGGIWAVQVTTGTQVVSTATSLSGDLTDIRVGDFVGVIGIIATGSPWSVRATLVRDWTRSPDTAPASTGSASGGSSSSSGSSSSVIAGTTLYSGTVTDIGSGSFTLTNSNGNSYTVNTDPDTTLWNNARETIDFSAIQSGDSVRLNGILSGTDISAKVVRDTSR